MSENKQLAILRRKEARLIRLRASLQRQVGELEGMMRSYRSKILYQKRKNERLKKQLSG